MPGRGSVTFAAVAAALSWRGTTAVKARTSWFGSSLSVEEWKELDPNLTVVVDSKIVPAESYYHSLRTCAKYMTSTDFRWSIKSHIPESFGENSWEAERYGLVTRGKDEWAPNILQTLPQQLSFVENASRASFLSNYPGYKYKNFDSDADLHQLIDKEYGSYLNLWESYPPAFMRKLAAKYFLLHYFGGIYADPDIVPVLNFEAELQKTVNTSMLIGRVMNVDFIANHKIMIAKPRAKFLAAAQTMLPLALHRSCFRNTKPRHHMMIELHRQIDEHMAKMEEGYGFTMNPNCQDGQAYMMVTKDAQTYQSYYNMSFLSNTSNISHFLYCADPQNPYSCVPLGY